jgi:hypothetical protein
LKTNERRTAVQRTAEQVFNDLCKVVAKALTLICNYRAKRNEMLKEIDPDSLLSEELKAESSFETKLISLKWRTRKMKKSIQMKNMLII